MRFVHNSADKGQVEEIVYYGSMPEKQLIGRVKSEQKKKIKKERENRDSKSRNEIESLG